MLADAVPPLRLVVGLFVVAGTVLVLIGVLVGRKTAPDTSVVEHCAAMACPGGVVPSISGGACTCLIPATKRP